MELQSNETVEYRLSGAAVSVYVPVRAVRSDEPLPPAAVEIFIDAIERAGVPVEELLAGVEALRIAYPEEMELVELSKRSDAGPIAVRAWALDPQPNVWIESLSSDPPWPVFVSIGSDVVAEFMPATP